MIDGQLIDDVVNTYVDWREQSDRVWRAYHDWSTVDPPDAALRFRPTWLSWIASTGRVTRDPAGSR